MTGLFAALESRFNGHAKLKLYGRKLYEGFEGDDRKNATRPFTEVTYAMEEDVSTFDTDVEIYDLRFRFLGKDLQALSARQWVLWMREAYREGNVYGPEFLTAGLRLRRASGPMLRNGLYDAEMVFEWIVERRTNSPVTVRT